MPGNKPVKKPVSKQQARFFGAVASGAAKAPGLSKEEAKRKLKGVKIKKLPKRAKKKK